MPLSKFDQVMMANYGGNGVKSTVKCMPKERIEAKSGSRERKPKSFADCRYFCAEGVVEKWQGDFGFIAVVGDQSESVFFHRDACQFSPRVGMRVSFTASENATSMKGPKAHEVTCLSSERAQVAPEGDVAPRIRRFQATGVVTDWRAKQDMGFITMDDKQTAVCYASDVGVLKVGTRVSFTALSRARGFKAVDLETIKDPCRHVPYQQRKHGVKKAPVEVAVLQPKLMETREDDEQSQISTTVESVVTDESWLLAQLG